MQCAHLRSAGLLYMVSIQTMLKRNLTNNGLVYYTAPVLSEIGVRHAFSTRIGGCSPPPFDSLNLGNPNGQTVQDDYQNIWANYRVLHNAIGVVDPTPLRVHQVHGNAVVEVGSDQPFDSGAKADAIVSRDNRRVVSVRVADCVPVLLACQDGKTVAAVHAGWRGVMAGVVPAAIARMGDAKQIRAAIGPCIGFDAFEVGGEVLAEFVQTFGADAPIRHAAGGKGYVDLRAAVRRQLLKIGVVDENIDISDRCTVRDADEFFSHRRENGFTGRMAAIIAAGKGR